ncbi:ATPase, T2SS/T4P/T4SS family [Streptococcus gallolyticus]|uniref:ATPase, T2SS/T4P/T4SS family n=1 Tax=Streptococcus gallolyticus TaxID=315405 RepID=UPI0022845798|nr:ATPase, T2SS/T4P/T4SS family [Streptococcus gallolyticus]MCY7187293.1 Flp pilus assembly complex ATPase component TadA [Streptococcus gallolyticus subsp. gallolyticus]
MTETTKPKKKHEAAKAVIHNLGELEAAEKLFRKFPDSEFVPYSMNRTSWKEVVGKVVRDKTGDDVLAENWKHPLLVTQSKHVTTIGVEELIRQANSFLIEQVEKGHKMDILSITAGVDGNQLSLTTLLRPYNTPIRIKNIYKFLGEDSLRRELTSDEKKSKLLAPESAFRRISKEEKDAHKQIVKLQEVTLNNATSDKPFLNQLESYSFSKLTEMDPRTELEYDLRTKDMDIQLNTSYDNFIEIFQEVMQYITRNKRDNYYSVLRNKDEEKSFFSVVDAHIKKHYTSTRRLPEEDLPALMAKLRRALFDLYIVQDLIDDPMITDVKITDPKSIRVRVHGKAYLSNITFIDAEDYFRFIQGVAVSNNIDLSVPSQTFTDETDDNYILRFSLTAPYITSTGYPIIHIRKIPRKKPMSEELMAAGMFDEKIKNYLIDQSINKGKSIVFAGPPGSGKTTALNWFLEDGYESSAEILVIQENDELFSYRKGVMFEHVVLNPQRGELPCTLEDLGKMALVAGANVFVIGEAKGGEISSAITLSNSGCRTAITIHSQSSKDTIDKMADLAMRGTANITYDQAKRMIKSFQIIVYMEDYQVKEISEIIGYDEEKKDMIYRSIYEAPARKK